MNKDINKTLMAIEALSQESSEDVISRQAAIDVRRRRKCMTNQ